MKVLAFTGMPGSGKTKAVEAANRRGLPVVRMGDLVWEETRRRGLTLTPENVGEVALALRQKEGGDVWAVRTLERVKTIIAPAVVVDGVRGLDEVERFRSSLGPDFILVAIHAGPEVRWQRIAQRSRADDTLSREQFEERDRRELAFGIGTAIALADVLIVNEGSAEDLRSKIDKLLTGILEHSS